MGDTGCHSPVAVLAGSVGWSADSRSWLQQRLQLLAVGRDWQDTPPTEPLHSTGEGQQQALKGQQRTEVNQNAHPLHAFD